MQTKVFDEKGEVQMSKESVDISPIVDSEGSVERRGITLTGMPRSAADERTPLL